MPFESFDSEKPQSQETIPVKSQAIPWAVGCDCAIAEVGDADSDLKIKEASNKDEASAKVRFGSDGSRIKR